eukprot:jgi/Psemu1/4949/gm1.4949_g
MENVGISLWKSKKALHKKPRDYDPADTALQQLLNNSNLQPQLAAKIEAKVLARLLPKDQNVSPVGIVVSPPKQSIPDQIEEAGKVLGNFIAVICDLEKINNNCAAARTKLRDCTSVLDQLRQQTMRVKEDIIEPMRITINIAKERSAVSSTALAFSSTQKQKQVQSAINVDSDEDLDMKPKSTKPKSTKPKSTKCRPAYMKHESQNFLKHCCFYLEPGNAVMKLSCHLWKYDTSFPTSNLSTKGGLRKVTNAVICITLMKEHLCINRVTQLLCAVQVRKKNQEDVI